MTETQRLFPDRDEAEDRAAFEARWVARLIAAVPHADEGHAAAALAFCRAGAVGFPPERLAPFELRADLLLRALEAGAPGAREAVPDCLRRTERLCAWLERELRSITPRREGSPGR